MMPVPKAFWFFVPLDFSFGKLRADFLIWSPDPNIQTEAVPLHKIQAGKLPYISTTAEHISGCLGNGSAVTLRFAANEKRVTILAIAGMTHFFSLIGTEVKLSTSMHLLKCHIFIVSSTL